MSDTFITIIAVMIVAVTLFVIPVMATANQNDNITQTAVQTIVSEFVNTSAKEGKITINNYDNFIQKLFATGNSYDVEIEVQILDDNPGRKGVKAIGENIYYSDDNEKQERKFICLNDLSVKYISIPDMPKGSSGLAGGNTYLEAIS